MEPKKQNSPAIKEFTEKEIIKIAEEIKKVVEKAHRCNQMISKRIDEEIATRVKEENNKKMMERYKQRLKDYKPSIFYRIKRWFRLTFSKKRLQ